MDNPNINPNKAAGPRGNQPGAPEDSDAPIPLDLESPIPLVDEDKQVPQDGPGAATTGGVSHAPLDLGGGPAPVAPRVQAPRPAAKPARKPVSTDRITGVKTFFTKLHPGALPFLDEQISNWLKENPGIVVRHTNITTGEVQAKKTEPNIIVTVWY